MEGYYNWMYNVKMDRLSDELKDLAQKDDGIKDHWSTISKSILGGLAPILAKNTTDTNKKYIDNTLTNSNALADRIFNRSENALDVGAITSKQSVEQLRRNALSNPQNQMALQEYNMARDRDSQYGNIKRSNLDRLSKGKIANYSDWLNNTGKNKSTLATDIMTGVGVGLSEYRKVEAKRESDKFIKQLNLDRDDYYTNQKLMLQREMNKLNPKKKKEVL